MPAQRLSPKPAQWTASSKSGFDLLLGVLCKNCSSSLQVVSSIVLSQYSCRLSRLLLRLARRYSGFPVPKWAVRAGKSNTVSERRCWRKRKRKPRNACGEVRRVATVAAGHPHSAYPARRCQSVSVDQHWIKAASTPDGRSWEDHLICRCLPSRRHACACDRTPSSWTRRHLWGSGHPQQHKDGDMEVRW